MVTMVAGKWQGLAGDGAEGGKNWTGWGVALGVKAGVGRQDGCLTLQAEGGYIHGADWFSLI